ncbi:MAG: hypothetical protein GX275_11395 [Clostridiales bacterium]|nr:hypothetical protein [Clostridiales bacterium]
MILKYKKFIFCLIGGIILLSCSYNIYQYNRIRSYEERQRDIVRSNIEAFVGLGGSIEDEIVYAKQYGNIVTAREAYLTLSRNKGIKSDEKNSSLSLLLLRIKLLMINDKQKFNEVFSETETSELMYKILDNFEDSDSIRKVYELIED